MNIAPAVSPARTITAAEVAGWFGPRSKPTDTQCGEIADFLTKMRWPGDPPRPSSPLILDGINRSKAKPGTANVVSEFWDLEAATKAAKALLASMPEMVRFWEGLRESPETVAGSDAIKALDEALSRATHYVEWPFGKFDRVSPHARKDPPDWHIRSVLIANAIQKIIGKDVSFARSAVLPRVILSALHRMGGAAPRSAGAVSQHLERWRQKYELPPQ